MDLDRHERRRPLRIDTSSLESSGRRLSFPFRDPAPSPTQCSPYTRSSSFLEWHEVDGDSVVDRPPEMSGIASELLDDVLYVFGGYHNGDAQDALYAFDVPSRTWTKLKTVGSAPSPRTSHSMVADESRQKLYVVCGSGTHFGSSNHNDVFELDLTLHSWRPLRFTGDELSSRYGQTCVLYDRKLFVFGGTSGREFNQDFFAMDLNTMRSRRLPALGAIPSPRYKHAAALFDQNKMVVFGGAEHSNVHLDDVAVVDLDTFVWTQLDCHGIKPGGRFAHSLCIHNDKAFVFGGAEGVDIFVLYIRARTWAKLDCMGSVPSGRYFLGQAFDSARGTLLVWGGKGASNSSTPRRYNTLHAVVVETPNDPRKQSSLGQDFLDLLRSGASSDLAIVADDGVEFRAHQLMVRVRCPHLADRITYGERDPLLHLPYASDAVANLLHFIYSDDVADDVVSDPALLATVVLADRLGLARLAALCDRRLRRRLTLDRALQWLDLLRGDRGLGLVRVLEFYVESHRSPTESAKPARIDPVRIPPSTIVRQFRRLRTSSWLQAECESTPFDLRFRLGSSQERLFAHRLILSARTTYFGSFAFREGMRESLTGVCQFPDAGEGVLSSRALNALLDYLYTDEVEAERDVAEELLKIDVVNFFGLRTSHLDRILRQIVTKEIYDKNADFHDKEIVQEKVMKSENIGCTFA